MAKKDKPAVKVKEEKAPAKPAAAGVVSFGDLERWFDEQFGQLSRGWPASLPRRLFEFPEFVAMPELRPPFEGRWPKVDVIDREEDVLVRAELPGVAKDDLDVTVTDRTVTIKASTRKETREDKEHYHRREITSGAFERTLPLAQDVEASQAKASLKDGVLELVLPKLRKGPRKNVKVD